VGSRGEAPVQQFAICSLQALFTDFDCGNEQNLKISHDLFLDS